MEIEQSLKSNLENELSDSKNEQEPSELSELDLEDVAAGGATIGGLINAMCQGNPN